MLTKNLIKYIQSLKLKKYRDLHSTFIVEGLKMNNELIDKLQIQYLILTKELISQYHSVKPQGSEIIIVEEKDFAKISNQKTPQNILGIYYKPNHSELKIKETELIIALDNIQDPGNLGTIVRLADWFGINKIICSTNTADIYSPKAIQSTMGAVARIECHYLNLVTFLQQNKHLPIYGTFLDGKNIYDEELTQNGIIIMGNEGNGISSEIKQIVNKKLLIPSYPTNSYSSESLNVSIATAIICSEFRRRI